jgi:RNA 2',3'-cyclic 3'-phosphodiesterase
MRLFVAARIPEGLRKELFSIGREFHPLFKGTTVSQENIHLTLEFLGEVTETKLAEIREALDGIKHPAFDISLRGMGCFPDSIHPRVLWAGVGAGAEELISLNNEIVRSFDYGSAKCFHPHATLARIKSKSQGFSELFERYEETKFGGFKLESFELMSSELSPRGSRYDVLKSFPLR